MRRTLVCSMLTGKITREGQVYMKKLDNLTGVRYLRLAVGAVGGC